MKIKCQVCGIMGYLQHIGSNYFRVRHYIGYRNEKAQFKYHRQEPKYVRSLMEKKSEVDQFDHSGQIQVDQNLIDSGSFNENVWAGSLVRIGRRPPKPVVVGSNPTPPVLDVSRTVFTLASERSCRYRNRMRARASISSNSFLLSCNNLSGRNIMLVVNHTNFLNHSILL